MKKQTINLIIGEKEAWYGGSVRHGFKMPLTKNSKYQIDFNVMPTDNQFNTVFVSTEGRYVISKGELSVSVFGGVFTVISDEGIEIGNTGKTLKDAYLEAASKLFIKSKKSVPAESLIKPQFCSWTETGVNVSGEKIVAYAKSIVDAGYAHDIMIIDDGWSNGYGDWSFDTNKFPNPKKTVDELHSLGFKVILWLVPFVNENTKTFETLKANGGLIRNADGSLYKAEWWNGRSCVLDLTSPFAGKWIRQTLNYLQTEYGVDGFKFDAGDPNYYLYDNLTYAPTTPVKQCEAWTELAEEFDLSELRACYKHGGSHVIMRLCDKRRCWNADCGIGGLVPDIINAGLCGYAYTCADMIGGGIISEFLNDNGENYDYEIISRFCECCALLPCMQFSYGYWKKNAKVADIFSKFINLHLSFSDYFKDLISQSEKDFSPIVRSLEYEFPHQGYEFEMHDFMLGDKILVSPVIKVGVYEKEVRLPSGCGWICETDGKKYRGGETAKVSCPIGTLVYFRRMNDEI